MVKAFKTLMKVNGQELLYLLPGSDSAAGFITTLEWSSYVNGQGDFMKSQRSNTEIGGQNSWPRSRAEE